MGKEQRKKFNILDKERNAITYGENRKADSKLLCI